MGYLKIPNLYKDMDIRLFHGCWALEKLHGTSAHVAWNRRDLSPYPHQIAFFAGGAKHDAFVALFDRAALAEKFAASGVEAATVYGEAYGGKLQRMSKVYGPDLRFAAFEVRIGKSWVSVPQAEAFVIPLGLEFVPYHWTGTSIEALNAERDADSVQAVRNGMGEGHPREGIVCRPFIELTKNNGERIICKHKSDAFAERAHPPRVVDPDRLTVLTDAQAIADEWVVPMRLQHVLDGLPDARGMEDTTAVIRAMIADIEVEAEGEIELTKAARTAIGKKTAQLWKAHLRESITP